MWSTNSAAERQRISLRETDHTVCLLLSEEDYQLRTAYETALLNETASSKYKGSIVSYR